MEEIVAFRDDGLLAAAKEIFPTDWHREHLRTGTVQPFRYVVARADVHTTEVNIRITVVDDCRGVAPAILYP